MSNSRFPELMVVPPPLSSRGSTCLNCRRRKIKCDGDRPTCSNCSRSNGAYNDCEYPDGSHTQSQLLEGRIHQVQLRIRKLENPSHYGSPITHHPHSPESSGSVVYQTASGSKPLISASARHDAIGSSMDYFQEPVAEHRLTPLALFASHCHQFSFFLHLDRFIESMSLSLPLGHPDRPTPALISAVYLWGTHLSPSTSTQHDENALLQASLHFLSEDLSGSHPHRVLHGIQAEVLLSYFYLKNGKLLRGNYHANSALSMCLSIGLHNLRPPIYQGQAANSHMFLPNQVPSNPDILAEEVRESYSMFYNLLEEQVHAPWPANVPGQEALYYPPSETTGTIRRFLEGESVDGFSDSALHAKASALLVQATLIHLNDTKPSPESRDFSHLDSLVDSFKSNLPLFDSFDTIPYSKYSRIVTQMIAHGATMALHVPICEEREVSKDKCLFAAQSVAWLTKNLIPDGSSGTMPLLDPIIGVLWTSACEVLMTRVLDIRAEGSENNNAIVSLGGLIQHITRYSERDELIRLFVSRFQTKYSAHLTPS